MRERFSVEDLIAHGVWARELAAHLVRGSASADDLAQDAWLAGAERPRPGNVSTRAWMTGILRNLARMRARSETRRRKREQDAAAAAFPSDGPVTPDRLLAEIEVHRVLAELLTSLREPLRSTVLLRYYDGRSSAQISREHGIPEGTVRRRLKEGLSELRTMLTRRYGAERWGLIVGPVAGARRGPLLMTPAGRGTVTLNKVVAVSSVAAFVVGAGALLIRWSSQQSGNPDVAALSAADRSPAGSASAAALGKASGANPDDMEGDERSMKMNRLRKAVQAIAIVAGSASAGAQAAPVATGIEVRGALEKDAVERVVAEHINEVKWCYEQERAKNPTLRGRVSVQFTVAQTGGVSDSKVQSSTIANPALEACVSRCPRRWQFPKPKDGQPATVTYPFELPLGE